MLTIDVSCEAPWPEADWPALADRAVTAAIRATPHGPLADAAAAVEVSVRLTSDAEVHGLNRQYRGKDAPTNVLSFPMVQPDLLATITQNSDDGEVLLGDIMLARETCAREAEERGIAVADHATHLIVHGTLHLLGYDHMTDDEGDAMESIERAALAGLGIADPYRLDADPSHPDHQD